MFDKLPYPWFGGKKTISDVAWKAFGDCINYVEPFFGGGAVMLMRPDYNPIRHTETVNDIDCNLANFWRAIKTDPESVAFWADYPVSEIDLGARNRWLITRTYSDESEFANQMQVDPDFYDAKQAGWWVWGINAWIGTGFCEPEVHYRRLPHLGNGGKGIHRKSPHSRLPHLSDSGKGTHRKLPHLGNSGNGTHRKLPHLGNSGSGIHRKLPHLGNSGSGIHRKSNDSLIEYLTYLSKRFRKVRVCCGDFERVLSKAVTFSHGLTGVFLDPPYSADRSAVYGKNDSQTVAFRAAEWAFANGDNPKLRIILCGYEGEHKIPDNWTTYAWKANGGYANLGNKQSRENSSKERLWLSPHCLPVEQKQQQLELAFG